jgi:hypothetical protein
MLINVHTQGYERTTPIRGGVPTAESPDGATVRPADHGTTYICAGGGGRHLSELSAPGEGFIANEPITPFLGAPLEPEAAPWSVVAALTHSLIKVDVTPPGPDRLPTMAEARTCSPQPLKPTLRQPAAVEPFRSWPDRFASVQAAPLWGC